MEADPLHSRGSGHRESIRQIRMRAQMVFQEFNLFPHKKVIDNLIEGTWFFTLSSVNASGVESRPTGAVSKIIG